MLLRKQNHWVAIGLKKIGRDLAGDLYMTVILEITPGGMSPPGFRSEAISKEGAIRAGLTLAKSYQDNFGYLVAEASLFEEAFENGIDPFAGIEPLPMTEIAKAAEKDKLRRALSQAKRQEVELAKLDAEKARADAEAAEKKAAAEFQRQRYDRLMQPRPEPGRIDLPPSRPSTTVLPVREDQQVDVRQGLADQIRKEHPDWAEDQVQAAASAAHGASSLELD